jgi:hypothetical protein
MVPAEGMGIRISAFRIKKEDRGNDMKITVDKDKLLAALTENRAKHEETYNDALDGYFTALSELFKEKERLTRAHKDVDLYVRFSRPRNHVNDYDRAIGMLTWHTGDTFDLTDTEYSSYVMDNWAWTGEWRGTARKFSASAYDKNYTDDDDEGDDESF